MMMMSTKTINTDDDDDGDDDILILSIIESFIVKGRMEGSSLFLLFPFRDRSERRKKTSEPLSPKTNIYELSETCEQDTSTPTSKTACFRLMPRLLIRAGCGKSKQSFVGVICSKP